jgi:hypothetical protein
MEDEDNISPKKTVPEKTPEGNKPGTQQGQPKLSKGKDIPPDLNIARIIPKRLLILDPQTKQLKGCYPQAFELRPQEHKIAAISVNLLEIFSGTKIQKLSSIRGHVNLTITPSHAFGVMKVADIIDTGLYAGLNLRVTYDPTKGGPTKKADPSHSSIRRLPAVSHIIFTHLASLASRDLIMSKHIP